MLAAPTTRCGQFLPIFGWSCYLHIHFSHSFFNTINFQKCGGFHTTFQAGCTQLQWISGTDRSGPFSKWVFSVRRLNTDFHLQQVAVRQQLDNRQVAVRQQLGSSLVDVRQLLGSCQVAIKQLLVSCQQAVSKQ